MDAPDFGSSRKKLNGWPPTFQWWRQWPRLESQQRSTQRLLQPILAGQRRATARPAPGFEGCHGDHCGQNGFDGYNQKWTRWQAIGWCQYLHVIVIFCDKDLDGCSSFDDYHDGDEWGWGTWYWGEQRITMSEERSSPPRSIRPTKYAEHTSLPPSIMVFVRFLFKIPTHFFLRGSSFVQYIHLKTLSIAFAMSDCRAADLCLLLSN